jgi:tetratricopeptide (TPR) repeat protein
VARVRGRVPADDPGPFVGRERETAVLEEQWRRAHDGGARVVVLEGEAGIGKTRLAFELARAAAPDGPLVLWGRCDPDVGLAHGPFADVLGQLLTERDDLVERMGALAPHLSLLVPQLVPEPGDASPTSPEQVTARLFRAVGTALQLASEQPLLLIVDDVHWADPDTLALLHHTLSWLGDRPCLVLLTLRDAPPPVAAALAELQRQTPTTSLVLGGLSVDEVVTLLAASPLTWDGELRRVATTVAARTAGNPLYVTELLREAEGSGRPFDPAAVPDAVARLLARRLGALDADLASVLVLAAIAGPAFDLETIEGCTTFAPDDLLDLIESLCRRRFLEERGPAQFAFAHDLVRDAVLVTVSATRQTRLHRRVADVLAGTGADPAVVARHYVAAGSSGLAEAVSWSLLAGQAALAGAAWATAREHFATAARLAADIEPRCEALIGLGRAERATGALHDARATLNDALALAQRHSLERAAAAATLALVGGGGRGVAVDLEGLQRADLLRAALAGLTAADDDLRVPLLTELAVAIVLTDARDERGDLSAECLAAARRWGDPNGLATALWARRTALMGPPGTEARVKDGEEALALPRAEIAPESVLAALLGLVEDLLELGDRTGADRTLDDAARLAADLDHPYWSWATTCWRTLTTIVDGRYDEAERLAFAALACQSGDHPEAAAALGVNLIDLRLLQGRAGEMIDLVHEAADQNPHIPTYRAVLALCCAEAGDHAGARDAFSHFAARGFELPDDSNWLLAVAVLADTCATLGDTEHAPGLAARLEPWADRQVILNCFGGGGAYWGPVAHHLGRLAALTGDPCRAQALLTRAVELSDQFRAPGFAARSRAALELVR